MAQLICSVNLDMSLHDLTEYNSVRSCHVGNLHPGHLAMCDVIGGNLTMRMYDRCRGKSDTFFHPHRIVAGGSFVHVASKRKLASHAETIRSVNGYPQGMSVIDLHIGVCRDCFPKTTFETFSTFLGRHKDDLLTLLEKATNKYPTEWCRFVNREGFVDTFKGGKTWNDVREKIYAVTDHKEGFVIPNLFNILISIVFAEGNLFHLAGDSMVEYVMGMRGTGMQKQLDQLYQRVQPQFSWLPDNHSFSLVPTSDIRLVINSERREQLDLLVETATCERSTHDDMVEAVKGCCPDVAGPMARSRPGHLSQHDLSNGVSLYVPEWTKSASMRDQAKVMRRIEKTIERWERS